MRLQTIILAIKEAYFDFSFLLSRLFTKITDQSFLYYKETKTQS